MENRVIRTIQISRSLRFKLGFEGEVGAIIFLPLILIRLLYVTEFYSEATRLEGAIYFVHAYFNARLYIAQVDTKSFDAD